jgi:hypothetical protein
VVRFLHPAKAPAPIPTTESGITVFLQPEIRIFVAVSIIALQLSRESYTVFSGSTVMLTPEKLPK